MHTASFRAAMLGFALGTAAALSTALILRHLRQA